MGESEKVWDNFTLWIAVKRRGKGCVAWGRNRLGIRGSMCIGPELWETKYTKGGR